MNPYAESIQSPRITAKSISTSRWTTAQHAPWLAGCVARQWSRWHARLATRSAGEAQAAEPWNPSRHKALGILAGCGTVHFAGMYISLCVSVSHLRVIQVSQQTVHVHTQCSYYLYLFEVGGWCLVVKQARCPADTRVTDTATLQSAQAQANHAQGHRLGAHTHTPQARGRGSGVSAGWVGGGGSLKNRKTAQRCVHYPMHSRTFFPMPCERGLWAHGTA